MRIKKDDMVMIITGKDKGKKGKVIKAMPKDDKVLVEGINMQTKHQKQSRTAAAEIKHQEGPIHVSNVMLLEGKGKTPTKTKVGYKMDGDKKVRFARKNGNVIE